MRQRKRMWRRFAFFDRTGIVRFLEREAGKGWVLEDISGVRWTFRRGEPKPAHVWVMGLPQDLYDPRPSPQLEELTELGAHTGWHLTVTTPWMQVFYNWQEDPLPMDTDLVAQVEGMHRGFGKTVLRGSWLWLLGLSVLLLMYLWHLGNHPIAFLSSTVYTYGLLLDGLLWVLVGSQLAGYNLWLRQARRKASQGEWADTHVWSVAYRAVGALVTGGVLMWLVGSLLSNHGASTLGAALGYAAACLAGLWGVTWLRDALRRRKAPRARTETATAVASFVLLVAVLAGAGALSDRLGWFSAGGADSWWSQYPGGMPLSVEQLRAEKNSSFDVLRLGEESLLVGRYQAFQIVRGNDPTQEGSSNLIYTVTLVKLPALYPLCRDEMLWADHTQVDPAPWLAQAAYHKPGEGLLDTYLLCYEDRLVEVSFGWKPTQTQKQMVGNQLGGEYNE